MAMKPLFLISTFLIAIPYRAQVACDILSAGPMQGSYAHTWAEPASGSWDTPNMTYASNRVIGDLVRALSSGPADSLCCAALANPALVQGKVAVIHRGTCDYALKAKHAQDAGAIAVVIINNVQGPPVEMGGGPYGPQVHIPVFMISAADGDAWREALEAGATLSVLLGNKDGYYAADAYYQDPARPAGLRGHDAILRYFQKLLAVNPAWVWRRVEILPTEKGCCLKWEASVPTGSDTVCFTGLDIVEIVGNKITRNEVYFDASLMK